MTEDEMVGWHHRLNLSKLLEIVKDREAWHAAVPEVEESDMAELLNKSELKQLKACHGSDVTTLRHVAKPPFLQCGERAWGDRSGNRSKTQKGKSHSFVVPESPIGDLEKDRLIQFF